MMMRLTRKGALMAIAIGTLVLSSCADEKNYYDENYKKELYAANWEKQFGQIDPNQDWNVATRVTANVNLVGLENAASVSVYTAMPGGKNCQIVATYPATAKNFSFDYVKGVKDAYVLVTDSNGKVLLGNYFTINNGELVIGADTKSSRAGDCATELGKQIVSTANLQDPNNYWDSNYYPNQYNPCVTYTDVFDFYQLDNVVKETGSSIKVSDMLGIVGTGGVFAEQGYDEFDNCNLVHWEEDLKPSEGAEYVMKSDGPMEITLMFGGTQKFNKLGYLYYKNGATEEEILSAPRYILMDNATPQGNITVDGVAFDDGMKLPGLVSSYESASQWGTQVDATLTGTTYQLAYFGEDGKSESSFTFPKGTHIVFFEIIGNNGSWWESADKYFTNIRYSLPWMNKYFYYQRYENHASIATPTWPDFNPAELFVTYKWNGRTVLGMEDEGGDDDMNDILFFVNGDFDSSTIVEIGDDPTPPSWILACEDLGDVDDFDFNDVVFSVSHVAGTTTATVTPLAAGGTLASHLYFGSTYEGEIHSFWDKSDTDGVYPIINTTSKGSAGRSFEITVGENFTMTDNMGGFSIIVEQGGNSPEAVIAAPEAGEAPQMICVPGTWLWPTERTNINAAYPGFTGYGDWNATNSWYDNWVSGKVVQ